MEYEIKMTPLKGRDDHIKAVGILKMGEIRIRNITLMESKDGELFMCMPSRDTKKTDENGKKIYEEIAHPITKEMREALNEAAVESYKEGHPVTLYEDREGSLLITAEAFDYPYYNKVGKGSLTINDEFVIKNVFINKKPDNSLYVSYPTYKTNKVAKSGQIIYSEIVSMGSGFRKKVSEAILNEYDMDIKKKEQNKISIKSRLLTAKEKGDTEYKIKDKLITPKPVSRI